MRPVSFELCRNYYEHLVFDEVARQAAETGLAHDSDALEDAACLALNQLPVRYVRFAVDASFYLEAGERAAMQEAVREAVERALGFVSSHPREHNVR